VGQKVYQELPKSKLGYAKLKPHYNGPFTLRNGKGSHFRAEDENGNLLEGRLNVNKIKPSHEAPVLASIKPIQEMEDKDPIWNTDLRSARKATPEILRKPPSQENVIEDLTAEAENNPQQQTEQQGVRKVGKGDHNPPPTSQKENTEDQSPLGEPENAKNKEPEAEPTSDPEEKIIKHRLDTNEVPQYKLQRKDKSAYWEDEDKVSQSSIDDYGHNKPPRKK
jgi:hypothetical protein